MPAGRAQRLQPARPPSAAPAAPRPPPGGAGRHLGLGQESPAGWSRPPAALAPARGRPRLKVWCPGLGVTRAET